MPVPQTGVTAILVAQVYLLRLGCYTRSQPHITVPRVIKLTERGHQHHLPNAEHSCLHALLAHTHLILPTGTIRGQQLPQLRC